jgi:hypothetical protein
VSKDVKTLSFCPNYFCTRNIVIYFQDIFLSSRIEPGVLNIHGIELKQFNCFKVLCLKLVMVVHACNPSTQEAEARGLRAQGQPGLYSKSLTKKKNPNKIK